MNVRQLLTNGGSHFKRIFKNKAGIQQAMGQDSPKKRDPLIFSFINDDGFQFLSLGLLTPASLLRGQP